MLTRYLKLRTAKGLSRAQVSRALDVTDTNIAGWETGMTEPTLANLRKVAEYYHVSADYLLGLTNVAKPAPVIRCTDCEDVRDYEVVQDGADWIPLCEDCQQARREQQQTRRNLP